MIVYIDNDFKCHVTSADGLEAVQSDFFDGKCAGYIEGFRFVPSGKSWTREDGVVFAGEMIAAWKPYAQLVAAQREYERELAQAALILLGEVAE